MFCPNCGGEHAKWVRNCPYCGSVNEAGDERLYMEHMENIRTRLDHVDEEMEEDYRREMRSSVNRLWKKVLIVVLAMAVLVTAGVMAGKALESRSEKGDLLQLAWEKEEFPKLDAWYEAGDYDSIVEEYLNVLNEDVYYSFYDWEHYTFLFDYYMGYSYMLQASELLKQGEYPDSYILGEALYGMVALTFDASDQRLKTLNESYKANGKRYGLSNDEVELVKGYRENVQEFMDLMGFDEAAVESLGQKCMKSDNYIDIGTCFDEAAAMVKEKRP